MVSALIADGPPSRLVEEAVGGQIELVLPGVVLSELERVLKAKLGFSNGRWRETRAFFTELASEQPRAPDRFDSVTGDPADDRILACAVGAEVEILATGDRKHLLPLGEHRGVRLITPQALLAELA